MRWCHLSSNRHPIVFRMFNVSILVVVLVGFAASASSDYYSSVSGLDKLLKVEEQLLRVVERLPSIDGIIETLDHIRDEMHEARHDSEGYVSNPISAFKLIKRFVVDWFQITELVKEQNASHTSDLDRVFNTTFEPPTEMDLIGAALGLVRLQKTYGLSVTDMSEGRLLGSKYGLEMTASDCLELAMSLYEEAEYKAALPWMLQALAKTEVKLSNKLKDLTDILQYLSAIYFYIGNPKMALLVTNEILRYDPANSHALENKAVYEENVLEERNSRKLFKQSPMHPKEPTVEEMYRQTCRGERHQSPSEERHLRCMYTTNGVPYRVLSPFKVEQLSLDPPITYFHHIFRNELIVNSIEAATPNLTRSTIGGVKAAEVSDIRTSKTNWLFYEHNEFLTDVATLLKDVTGLTMDTAEPLQVVNYGIGGHYAPHFDFTTNPEDFGEWRGNRIATALIYLNDVDLGGGTAFPFLKLVVPPEKGSLVLWYNLHESLEADFRTKHAGCPVLKGSKWILNEWFHERGQEFTRPCCLEEEGFLSKHLESVE